MSSSHLMLLTSKYSMVERSTEKALVGNFFLTSV